MYTILAGKTRLDIMTLHHLLTDPTGDFTTSIPNFCERWSSVEGPCRENLHPHQLHDIFQSVSIFTVLYILKNSKRKSIMTSFIFTISDLLCILKIISLHSDLQTSSILFMGIYDTFQYCTRLCPPVSSLASQVTMNITHDISLMSGGVL